MSSRENSKCLFKPVSTLPMEHTFQFILSCMEMELFHNAFVPSRQSAEITIDLKIAASLRTQIVVSTSFCFLVQPDAWQQIKMLICCHALLNRNQQLIRNSQSCLFTGLKRWNWCSQAACCTVATGLNHREVHTITHHIAFASENPWCLQ